MCVGEGGHTGIKQGLSRREEERIMGIWGMYPPIDSSLGGGHSRETDGSENLGGEASLPKKNIEQCFAHLHPSVLHSGYRASLVLFSGEVFI